MVFLPGTITSKSIRSNLTPPCLHLKSKQILLKRQGSPKIELSAALHMNLSSMETPPLITCSTSLQRVMAGLTFLINIQMASNSGATVEACF